jgi:hypothetical protein
MDMSKQMGSGVVATRDEAGRYGKPRALRLAIALASGATMLLAASHASAEKPSVEGVWRVTRHGVNCATGQQLSSFQAIMLFNKEETVTGFGVPPFSTPANGSPDYGVWKREPGKHQYSFKLLSNNYDDAGAFDGTTEVSARLELANGGDALSYRATVSFFDANGQFLFSGCGTATGTRFE